MEKLAVKDIPCMSLYFPQYHHIIRVCPHVREEEYEMAGEAPTFADELTYYPSRKLIVCDRCGVVVFEHVFDRRFLLNHTKHWSEVCSCKVIHLNIASIMMLQDDEKGVPEGNIQQKKADYYSANTEERILRMLWQNNDIKTGIQTLSKKVIKLTEEVQLHEKKKAPKGTLKARIESSKKS